MAPSKRRRQDGTSAAAGSRGEGASTGAGVDLHGMSNGQPLGQRDTGELQSERRQEPEKAIAQTDPDVSDDSVEHEIRRFRSYTNDPAFRIYEGIVLSQTDNPPPFFSPCTQRAQDMNMQGLPVNKGKFVHDRVHGQVYLDGLLVAVMDTPEFQVWLNEND
eukprot:6023830-Pleurochrysis_carterae.AAC.4